MALTRARGINASFVTADDDRKALASVFPREGIFPDPTVIASGVAYAGTGWGVNARAFNAALRRGGAPYSQAYGPALISNDAVATGAWTIGGAPGSGSRIDLLCVRARDFAAGDSTTGAPTDGPSGATRAVAEFLVVAGTAATTPAEPSLPAGYTRIAKVTTPSGAGSIAGSVIVNDFPFAQVDGGTIVVRTETERDALTNVIPGDDCYVISNAQVYVRTASAWKHLAEVEEVGTFTYGSLYTNSAAYDNISLTRRGKRIRVRGSATINQTVTFAANTVYTLGTVPVGWRPNSSGLPFRPAIFSPQTAGWLQVSSAGELQFSMAAGTVQGAGGWLIGFDFEYDVP